MPGVPDLGYFADKARKVLMIENPKSGQGNSGLDDFKVLLFSSGFNLEIREVTKEIQITDLLADVEKFDCVIAAGGDGTVCCIAHALNGRDVPVFSFPAGTANLIAQNLSIPTNIDEMFATFLTGKMIRVDVPEISSPGYSSGFIVAAGAGIDASMIKDSEEMKEKMGVWAYILAALKQVSPVISDFTLNIDGKTIQTRGMSVLVCNLGKVNLRIPITEGIDPTDGYLNVIILKGNSPLSLLPNVFDSIKMKLGLGDPIFQEHLEIYHGRKIVLDANPPMPVQYDGELFEAKTPVKIEVNPRATRFICGSSDLAT